GTPGRERRRHRGDRHAAARQLAARKPDQVRVHAHGRDRRNGGVGGVRLARLGAQPADLARRVGTPSVVRSTMRTAISSATSLPSRLIERVARAPARSCAPTWSTPGRPCRICRSAASEPTTPGPAAPAPVTAPPVTPAATTPAAPVTTSAFMPLLLPHPLDDRGHRIGALRADLDGVPQGLQRRVEPPP